MSARCWVKIVKAGGKGGGGEGRINSLGEDGRKISEKEKTFPVHGGCVVEKGVVER